jgi:rSAM/selenodomain-associated transferase 1
MAERRRGGKRGDARPLLIIMLKEPVMGRVKTRLAREVGWAAATNFARHAGRTLIARLERDERWRMVLAVTPQSALGSRFWPKRVRRMPQGRGDLGARMRRLLGPERRPAIVIGADIPAVSPALIAEACRALRSHDVVFGPAEDGGYWLVGAARPGPRQAMFANVRWSTSHALEDTLAGLEGVRIGYAARLGDVDNGESYRRLKGLAGRLILPATRPMQALRRF